MLINLLLACAAVTLMVLAVALLRGSGPAHKKLVHAAVLLGIVLGVRFGVGGLLALFGMGWRCTPRNWMDLMAAALFGVAIWRGLSAFAALGLDRSRLGAVGVLCSVLTLTALLIGMVVYPLVFSWRDWSRMDAGGQQIVEEFNGHGGSGDHRYYRYVNGLVHGERITDQG